MTSTRIENLEFPAGMLRTVNEAMSLEELLSSSVLPFPWCTVVDQLFDCWRSAITATHTDREFEEEVRL